MFSRGTLFLLLLLHMMFLRWDFVRGDAQVVSLGSYIVIVKSSSNVDEMTKVIKRRNADRGEPLFHAQIDGRSMITSFDKVSGFRVVCDEKTANEIAKQEQVYIVEKDSVIRLDGY